MIESFAEGCAGLGVVVAALTLFARAIALVWAARNKGLELRARLAEAAPVRVSQPPSDAAWMPLFEKLSQRLEDFDRRQREIEKDLARTAGRLNGH